MPDKKYARRNIAKMEGYTPGEQPRGRTLIKLNTNENPYPPSPAVTEALQHMDANRLRLYPDPVCTQLREEISELYGLSKDWAICGNGSDDLLTIAVRTFVDQNAAIAYPDPSYSLYPVLADIQGARHVVINLTATFGLPANVTAAARDASLLFLARPNAPTGNCFPVDQIRMLADEFDGILYIDEAYADFADDNCIDLVREFPNVIVSRTLSKSYSLAGIRLGYAFAHPDLIAEMGKVKDSYNVNMLTQALGLAAIRDREYFAANVKKVRQTRERVTKALDEMGFATLPSQANFLFTKPPVAAAEYVQSLRDAGILVRYFPGKRTGDYVRITIGTDDEMDALIAATKKIVEGQ